MVFLMEWYWWMRDCWGSAGVVFFLKKLYMGLYKFV
jgi:hypothetical protein